MKTTIVLGIALLASVTVALAQGPVRPGRWEVTMQMQMAGSPIQMPEMKTTRCITPEDAKDPTKSLPKGAAIRSRIARWPTTRRRATRRLGRWSARRRR
jgi:hypothetical protein